MEEKKIDKYNYKPKGNDDNLHGKKEYTKEKNLIKKFKKSEQITIEIKNKIREEKELKNGNIKKEKEFELEKQKIEENYKKCIEDKDNEIRTLNEKCKKTQEELSRILDKLKQNENEINKLKEIIKKEEKNKENYKKQIEDLKKANINLEKRIKN